ncbi:ER-derived vesicles protein ERV14 [Thecamonas trahens ATCC 50062]|uniref:ER-derived vesicles protein ERV14 n=1 Tax=Thecamonas trahens ATCC 50062 TaxID=461836 RepID=A0A0L0D5I7_THETB|nr:ER-derived vesicles protein ERV14 [Thecamonas trahens ATCC 50062]KNC47356.1 ER-derived vesicles protein ERV14 [Thecamonas trahens ATCC 50062]|eukprot:XP_013759694.1 ER-derived vesicles protein ERV14 [Thecamonas trahens ATCC 50062]
MEWSVLLWILMVVMAAVLLFIMVFFIIELSDLASDFVSPVECCRKLSPIILPEYFAQLTMTVLMLITLNFTAFIINAPLAAYHVYSYQTKSYWLDPTDIFPKIDEKRRVFFIKLGFYLILFFYYLYCMIMSLISD